MVMKNPQRIARVLAVILTGTTSAAFAQDVAKPGAAASGAFGAAAAVTETELRVITGRDDLGAMVASANQRNTVANNSVTGTSTTGSVRIDGNAFQNLQGLAVINANSGNNVAINSAMNVVVNLAPR